MKTVLVGLAPHCCCPPLLTSFLPARLACSLEGHFSTIHTRNRVTCDCQAGKGDSERIRCSP
eukprot:1141220-Pelagomonas_calceolata.AAC.2